MGRFDYALDLGTSAVLGKRGRVNISPGNVGATFLRLVCLSM
jgi:hypothetical protein